MDGAKLAAALRSVGAEVIRHKDLFGPETPDTEWLERAGRQGWIALTRDKRIRYREHEWAAVVSFDVRLFTLKARGPLTGAEMAESVVEALPTLRQFLKKHKPPFVAKITRNGRVELERNV